MTFKAIETYSNWCYIDKLDGRDIVDGERVRVRWPDGSTTDEDLRLERKTFTYGDMGHDCVGPNHKAYLETRNRGVTARFYLRGSGILLERHDD